MSFTISFKQIFPIFMLSIAVLTACNSGVAPPEAPPQAAAQIVAADNVVDQAPRLTAIQESGIWAGPDAQYGQVGSFGAGQMAEIIGRSELGTHWVIGFPTNATGQGWIAAATVSVQGDLSNVPVIFAQPLPEITEEPAVEQDAPAEESASEESAEEVPVEPEADDVPETEPEEETPEDVTPEEEEFEPTPEVEPVPEDDGDDNDDEDTPGPAEGAADDFAPVEPEVEPTPIPPVVDGGKIEVEPTPVPPTNGIDQIAPQPTATPGITIDSGMIVLPTPTPEIQLDVLVAVPVFVQQPTYNDCANRPVNTICLGFSDGYKWLIEDSVLDWSEGEHEGQFVLIAEGAKGYYHHVMGTDLVKFVPKG